MKDAIINLILRGNNSHVNTTLSQTENRLKSFSSTARREFDTIRGAVGSLQGKLAGIGISVGGVMLVKQSAALDQSLTRIGQTADIDRVKVQGLRRELFRMANETGTSVENISLAFNKAVQAGLELRAAIPVADAVNKANAVTGADAETLTASLTSSAAIFGFDLSKQGQAMLMLDKMRVAGKKGNAEMENLASVMPRVGFGAKRAGMSFEQTLGFVEALSQAEQQPERLATLAASWLRLFTNNTYMKKAQRATGVPFFDPKTGARRDALTVYSDIKGKYDKLKTDTQRHAFISRFLEGADTETITASVAFMEKGYLDNAKTFSKAIETGAGTLARELPDAINNAIAQTGRLKAEMRNAADAFIIPLNEGITAAIKKMLDAKKEGGMEMSGKELAAAGAAALGVGYLGYRLGGKALKGFLGKLGRTGAGIAEGKAIEYATGVTPVFVTNWPGSMETLAPSSKDAMKRAEDLFKKPNAVKKVLPWLAGAGLAVGTTAATALVAEAYRERGHSMSDLGASLHGMPDMGIGDEAWVNEHLRRNEIKNDITISVMFDQYGRVITQTGDPNTRLKVDLNRGTWDNPLGVQ